MKVDQVIRANNRGSDPEGGPSKDAGRMSVDQNENMGTGLPVAPRSRIVVNDSIRSCKSVRSDTAERQAQELKDMLVQQPSDSNPAQLRKIQNDIAELRMLILQQNQLTATPSPHGALVPTPTKKKRITFSPDIPEKVVHSEAYSQAAGSNMEVMRDMMNAMSKQLLSIQRQLNENGKRDREPRRKMNIPLIQAPMSVGTPATPNEITPRIPSHGRNNVAHNMDTIDFDGILKR